MKQIVTPAPDPIRREPKATFDLADPVQFQKDFRASRMIDSTWTHQGNTVQVTGRGGQAHQPSSIDKNKRLNGVKSAFFRRQVPGDESLRAPNPLGNPDGSFWGTPTGAQWHSASAVIADWNQQWLKTDEWEKGWTHTSLFDCFIVTRTFQTWLHRCSTFSYFGSLLRILHLVVRGNGN